MFVRRRDLEPITEDLSLIIASLMGLDARLDEIEELIRRHTKMTRKKGPTPDELARWEETKRRLQERVEWHAARKRERLEREERRRRRLRRLSFGLLGR